MRKNELPLYLAQAPNSAPYPASGFTTRSVRPGIPAQAGCSVYFHRRAECVTQTIRDGLLKHQWQKHQPNAKQEDSVKYWMVLLPVLEPP